MLQVVEIDVLDGKGLISVAVEEADASRLLEFIENAISEICEDQEEEGFIAELTKDRI